MKHSTKANGVEDTLSMLNDTLLPTVEYIGLCQQCGDKRHRARTEHYTLNIIFDLCDSCYELVENAHYWRFFWLRQLAYAQH